MLSRLAAWAAKQLETKLPPEAIAAAQPMSPEDHQRWMQQIERIIMPDNEQPSTIEPDRPRMCRRHGPIEHRFIRMTLGAPASAATTEDRVFDFCGECYLEMLQHHCNIAIPIPEKSEPYVGS